MAFGRWYTSSVVLLAWVFSACSGKLGTTGEPEADAGTRASRPHSSPQDTSSQSPEASGRIGPAGGTVTIKDGIARGATIAIPAGALSTPTTITMRVTSRPTDMPPDTFVAGPVVEFGPSGQTFAKPTTITLPATRPSVGIYTRHNGGPWTRIPDAHYDPSRRVMIASLNHFSPAFPYTSLDSPPTTEPPGRRSAGFLLKQNASGKFNSKVPVTCGITLVTTGAMTSQNTGNVTLTTLDCLAGDTDASHYLAGFGSVRNVPNIVIQPNSQMINGSPCKGTPTDGNTNLTIPSLYPVQDIMMVSSSIIVALLLGKHVPTQPIPIATAQTVPQGGWLDYHRYSDGKTPSELRKGGWLAIIDTIIGSGNAEGTVFIASFPTNMPSEFIPGDGGIGLYYTEDTGSSLVGLLSKFSTQTQKTEFVAIQSHISAIETAIDHAKDWNDCY